MYQKMQSVESRMATGFKGYARDRAAPLLLRQKIKFKSYKI